MKTNEEIIRKKYHKFPLMTLEIIDGYKKGYFGYHSIWYCETLVKQALTKARQDERENCIQELKDVNHVEASLFLLSEKQYEEELKKELKKRKLKSHGGKNEL